MDTNTIPPKIVIMLKEDIIYSMQSIANMMTYQSTFPDQAKISSVTPAFKKDDKMAKQITGQSAFCLFFPKYYKK